VIDEWTRERLRQRATNSWQTAKLLTREATDRHMASGHAPQTECLAHDTARAGSLAQWGHGLGASIPSGPGSPSEIEMLVDRAIRRSCFGDDWEANGSGAGLVASNDLPTLLRLQNLLGERLSYVVGAHDAGTALGLAIATQPDVAIVDVRLDLASGADVAFTLPAYAPRTKTLLLTEDDDLAAKAKVVGVETLPHCFSEQRLLSWITDGGPSDRRETEPT